MALAWVHGHDPDALIDGEACGVPYIVPDGWRFTLLPPLTGEKEAEDD
jgi:hypothetical protein